jgi:hypothetical protein
MRDAHHDTRAKLVATSFLSILGHQKLEQRRSEIVWRLILRAAFDPKFHKRRRGEVSRDFPRDEACCVLHGRVRKEEVGGLGIRV